MKCLGAASVPCGNRRRRTGVLASVRREPLPHENASPPPVRAAFGLPCRLVAAPAARRAKRDGGGGAEPRLAHAASAAGTGGPCRHQHLPVLRRRLRAAGLREERQADPYRGRSAQPGQPGNAVPEGRRHARHAAVGAAGEPGALPRAARGPTGRQGRSTGRWSASPSA